METHDPSNVSRVGEQTKKQNRWREIQQDCKQAALKDSRYQNAESASEDTQSVEQSVMDIEQESELKKRSRFSSGSTPQKNKKQISIKVGEVRISAPTFGGLPQKTPALDTNNLVTTANDEGPKISLCT